MDVAIVGAGISGLAAAYELQRRGARVVVHEASGVGAGQSAGLARIFRVAHSSSHLCALALDARSGWLEWERDLGAGRLLGEEGLVVARGERQRDRAVPDEVDVRAAAMRAAGAPAHELTAAEVRERVPFFDYDVGAGASCVLSPELYGLPIGSTGRYGVGMHDQDAGPAMAAWPVVDRVECVSLFAPWLDAHGDGFLALRAGRVTAFTGANLMKFGPLLGDRLARSVLDGAVHPDLIFGH